MRNAGNGIAGGATRGATVVEQVQPDDLQHEIGVVRGLIADLISSDLPVALRVAAINTAALALARLLRANRDIVGERGDVQAEVDRALHELGLGDE